jgi:hypothetical protein
VFARSSNAGIRNGFTSAKLHLWSDRSPSRKQFLQSKRQGMRSTKPIVGLPKPKKELTMEYLILVAVVSMMALYALIIVGCLKQPEW